MALDRCPSSRKTRGTSDSRGESLARRVKRMRWGMHLARRSLASTLAALALAAVTAGSALAGAQCINAGTHTCSLSRTNVLNSTGRFTVEHFWNGGGYRRWANTAYTFRSNSTAYTTVSWTINVSDGIQSYYASCEQ